ncbi:hypothetical protein [Tsukamurella soli]|uniref:PIN domain-containing protein n=1 Tax=Tsukamurella soli TaxID=644556 RepID=A0ABP8JPK1_9ACTN
MTGRVRAVFVDTSVVCNLLGIPGKSRSRERISREYERLLLQGVRMVLPVSAVIETGDHIAHITTPNVEIYSYAVKFAELLQRIVDGSMPWRAHEFARGRDTLARILRGVHDEPMQHFLKRKVGVVRTIHPGGARDLLRGAEVAHHYCRDLV